MLRAGAVFGKITTESQSLLTMLRTYPSGRKGAELIFEHLKMMNTYISKNKTKIKAKDFPSNHQWFNSKPLSLNKQLKGKLVVIDFWTY
jgi:hypothetical protein